MAVGGAPITQMFAYEIGGDGPAAWKPSITVFI
jgi:hypothetical protein